MSWLACSVAAEPSKLLDDFADASSWKVIASEGVHLDCNEQRAADGVHKSSLRLDLKFVSGAGYAGIRREMPIDLPANFELAFSVRGNLPRNNLELKLVDPTGENVWWVNRRGFEFPHAWTRLASRRRHFQFAWGPSRAPLKRISAIEIIISSVDGGRGTVYLDDLTLRPLPEPRPYTGSPTVTASSQANPSTAPQFACDAKLDTAWRSGPQDREPVLTVDFGVPREFGGLVINWDPDAYALHYHIQFSDDGSSWTTVRTVDAGGGHPQFIALPDSEARMVRLVTGAPIRARPIAIREIEVLPLDASRDANAFAEIIARRSPRGFYPRAFLDEGTFWTVVGTPNDEREALVSEDGAVEVDKQAFSIEAFLFVNGRFLSWADAKTMQSLSEGFAPIPTVVRGYDGLKLSVTAAAAGEQGDSSLLLLYRVTNTLAKPVAGKLFLAVRPFQVNPPYQWLNTVGGVSEIGHVALRKSRRIIDIDDKEIALGEAPGGFGTAVFDEGDVTAYLSHGQTPPHDDVTDPQRAASAAMAYDFQVDAAKSRAWVLCVPFASGAKDSAQRMQPLLTIADPVGYVRQQQQAVADSWRAATSAFKLLVPPEAEDIVNTVRSNLAYILINRDGAGIQPGSRSYERSWIRDGSLTSTALLRFGQAREAREFVDWYASYQFNSGKIPCVVDRRGPDPVPENDSNGEFIMAVMNVYRFTTDKAFLRKHWPQVQKAVAYIETLRQERMTAEYSDPHTTRVHREPTKAAVSLHAFYGLMPESISHEGYSAKPMHSYWDDFFTLRGLKDAAEMAHILDERAESRHYQALADDFARTLYASIDATMKAHKIDYIPGCVELGDFDATSTTVALWPCGELSRLPRPALERTFNQYWEQFVRRRDDPNFAWNDYTPYELRCVGSMILLGRVERAYQALEYFMKDRRPPGWNQWPEVVYREPRTAKFIGDLPHTWCGSDFLNSVRMMFLYEREADDSLVLLAGVPKSWISSQPVGFKDMPTYGGRISCTMERATGDGNHLIAHIEGNCPIPRGYIHLANPLGTPANAMINGKPAEMDAEGRIVVRKVPATLELSVAPNDAR